jgi:hypothetical protein
MSAKLASYQQLYSQYGRQLCRRPMACFPAEMIYHDLGNVTKAQPMWHICHDIDILLSSRRLATRLIQEVDHPQSHETYVTCKYVFHMFQYLADLFQPFRFVGRDVRDGDDIICHPDCSRLDEQSDAG